VHPRDLAHSPTVLYVVGSGMEVWQFAYFSRRQGAVIGVDLIDEMLSTCRVNLRLAEKENSWCLAPRQPDRRGQRSARRQTDR
jgi:hypothetical protein